MSAVAALYNVPSTQEELNTWAFCHAAHHLDINRTIYLRTGTTLASYVLDPLDLDNFGTWLYQHQVMHQNMDAILQINGYDLLDANLKDPNEFAGWIFANSDEHKQAADILGIG